MYDRSLVLGPRKESSHRVSLLKKPREISRRQTDCQKRVVTRGWGTWRGWQTENGERSGGRTEHTSTDGEPWRAQKVKCTRTTVAWTTSKATPITYFLLAITSSHINVRGGLLIVGASTNFGRPEGCSNFEELRPLVDQNWTLCV